MRKLLISAGVCGGLALYGLLLKLNARLFAFHRALLARAYTWLGWLCARFAAPAAEWVALILIGLIGLALIGAAARALKRRSPAPLLRFVAGLLALCLPAGALCGLAWPAVIDDSPRARAAYGGAYDMDKLYKLIYFLNDALIASEPGVDLSGARMRLSDKETLAARAAKAYGAAGLAPDAVAPKFSARPEWMVRLNTAGIFIPFTGEMIINPRDMDSALPFTMLHEIAHSLGALREDEANLAALYVGLDSDDAELKWSSALTALGYALNTLRALDETRFAALRARLSPAAIRELDAQGAFNSPPPSSARFVGDVSAPAGALAARPAFSASAAGSRFRRASDFGDYDGVIFLLLAGELDAEYAAPLK